MIGALDLLGAGEEGGEGGGEAATAPAGGTDWGAILKTAGDVGMAAFQAVQTAQAGKGVPEDEKAKLSAVVAADAMLANTASAVSTAALMVRGQPKGKRRAAAQARLVKAKQDAQAAKAAQEAAAAALPPTQSANRLTAAQAALEAAKARPPGAATKSLVKAWEGIVANAQTAQKNAQIVTQQSASGTEEVKPGTGFFDRKVGPLTFKQYGIGAAGLLVAGLIVRRMHSK